LARTVLLADDSVTAQNMGRRILLDAGYEVITVNNGSAALKKIHESRPDLIVLDVYMPGYGGLEVCQRLKETRETAKIPVLLTVGKMEPFKVDEAKRVRADAHIVKPFEASELLAALARLEDRIVPQPEIPRTRKAKSARTDKPWRISDPALVEDSRNDNVSYLAELKQQESAEGVESSDAKHDSESAPDEEEVVTKSQVREMPRPMSVYAAEQLQELPVVAEAAPTARDWTPVQGSSSETTTAPSAGRENDTAPAKREVPASAAQQQSPPEEAVAKMSEQIRSEETGSSAQAESAAFGANREALESSSKPAVVPGARWVAENVAVSAEEAALELDREMQKTQSQAPAAEPQPESTPSERLPASSWNSGPDQANGATFAAAASAGSSSAVSQLSAGSQSPLAPDASSGSEAAAAWENWQQIRDSVMGGTAAAAISQSVSELVQTKAAESEPSSPANSSLETANEAQASENGDADAALSTIVDTVLAELKPRLMKEISKKLKK
jgi:CheY-like chemotaxis protein